MLNLNIPGRSTMSINHLVLDYNGTLANDGVLLSGVKERLDELNSLVDIHIITADTNGSVSSQCAHLPGSIHIIGKTNQSQEKMAFVKALKPVGTIAIGNGANDKEMFDVSELAIAIVGNEGCATPTLLKSDVVVSTINEGLDLLLKPHRLIATLRG